MNTLRWTMFLLALGLCSRSWTGESGQSRPFPAEIPLEKPTGRPLSAAVQRLYDVWNPHKDRGSELYSNFKYSRLQGFSYENNTSRRDPSKVLKINGTYYVWYTRRQTEQAPSGARNATDTIPSTDWDLAEIWYATSKDGFTWQEQGVAVKRLPKPQYGWRSVSTPDVLAWGDKYYLYYQGFNETPGLKGDRAATTVAESDSPDGPWQPWGRVVVDFGAEGEWDGNAIHDPYPLVYRGKIHLYYKGSPGKGGRDGTLIRAQGLAIADHPLGPFTKSPLNPVLNSGHETCLWPWKGGIAAIVSLDGPEKNTVQYARDGVNFQMMSILQVPPIAPGPFVPDAFADNGNGRGLTWGLCHINPDGGGSARYSILARFDCDLSLDVDRPALKRDNLRFDEATYFQHRVRLPDYLLHQIQRERNTVDRDTMCSELVSHPADRTVPATRQPDHHPEESARTPIPTDTMEPEGFPAVMPEKKPTDRPLSAAWSRMWDRWNPHEDRGNELYSNFKYTPLKGFSREANVSRRDPSKVLKIEGTYYVWYTCRRSDSPPAGLKGATETIPGTDWDLADIWYATSQDGITWKEQGPAVRRPARPTTGFRSICTPDVLIWKGRYYLYFQAYSPMVGGQQRCPVMVAVADSPNGPWTLIEKPVIEPGPSGSWDNIKINDPCLLVYRGKILMYYKGAPIERGDQYVLRVQGVAYADDPLGPFTKSPLNPVINSGHETCMWPWKSGIAALVALDGPEKNTIQYAPDGENFEITSIIQVPPIAPGPFLPDAFADSGHGRGLSWGLCHINPDGGGATSESILARFDCDLSLNVDRPLLKRNNLRFEASTYFQPRVRLSEAQTLKRSAVFLKNWDAQGADKFKVDGVTSLVPPSIVDQQAIVGFGKMVAEANGNGRITIGRIPLDYRIYIFEEYARQQQVDLAEQTAQTVEGEPITRPNGNTFLCSNSPFIRKSMKKMVEICSAAGCDWISADLQTASHDSLKLGGCFCPHCERGFAEFLGKPATWSYREHLQHNGYRTTSRIRREARRAEASDMPLYRQYRSYQHHALRECYDAIRNQRKFLTSHDFHGHSAPLGTYVDFDRVGEAINRTSNAKIPLLYKLTDAAGRMNLITEGPEGDWENKPLGRLRLAQAYAYGAIWVVPYQQGIRRDGEWKRVSPDVESLYAFIRTHANLFDGYETWAYVGLIYSHLGHRHSATVSENAVETLVMNNVPFRLCVAGSDWWQPDFELKELVAFVTTSDMRFLEPPQKRLVHSLRQPVVDVASLQTLWKQMDRPIEVSLGDAVVNVVPRKRGSDRLLHLVNMELGTTHRDFTVRVSNEFAGHIADAEFFAPGQAAANLVTRPAERFTEIRVPSLKEWAIIALHCR